MSNFNLLPQCFQLFSIIIQSFKRIFQILSRCYRKNWHTNLKLSKQNSDKTSITFLHLSRLSDQSCCEDGKPLAGKLSPNFVTYDRIEVNGWLNGHYYRIFIEFYIKTDTIIYIESLQKPRGFLLLNNVRRIFKATSCRQDGRLWET